MTGSAGPASDALTRRKVGEALLAGDTAEAERLLRLRIAQAPLDADATNALADILARNDRIPEATALLHGALELAPQAQAIRIQLSALHQQQSHFPISLALLQQVPPEMRDSFELRAREAALLGNLGRREEEIAIYDELVKVQPKNAALWMSLGNALSYAGRTADAVKALRRAIKVAPEYGEPWWSLANIKSFCFDDRDTSAMQIALHQNPMPIDALHFHFALGRAFEQRTEYARSFDHYATGNRLRAATLQPSQMGVTDFVDRAIATFTPELFDCLAGNGCESCAPIFVVGLQRSGSTLIEQILAAHPAIEATAELVTMQHLSDDLAALSGGNLFEAITHADPAILRQIGEEYLTRTCAFRRLDRPRFIDKLPANWMNIGLIRLVFPNAKIIDARRHPLAAGFSNFKQHYATGVTFAYSLESIGRFYRDYLRLMQHFDQVQPGAVLHLIHERVVKDPEGEIRRALEYLGLPFDPACLEFHKSKRAVHTPSAEQVRRPISREGLNQWKHYEPWLGPLQAALGPALDHWDHETHPSMTTFDPTLVTP